MNNTVPKTKSRPLKVYQKYSQRADKYTPLPEIRLYGKWLKKEGFHCGQKIRVLHQKNKIVITNTERILVIL